MIRLDEATLLAKLAEAAERAKAKGDHRLARHLEALRNEIVEVLKAKDGVR